MNPTGKPKCLLGIFHRWELIDSGMVLVQLRMLKRCKRCGWWRINTFNGYQETYYDYPPDYFVQRLVWVRADEAGA